MPMPHGPPSAWWGEPAASSPSTLQVCWGQKELARELAAAAISSPELLECTYYAAEPDLLALMRVSARLDPEQRAKVLAYAQAIGAEGEPTAL